MWELTKSFRFEAAHALSGTTLGEASMEIHGHSFRAEVTVRGAPDPATGMVLDLGVLERSMADGWIGILGAAHDGWERAIDSAFPGHLDQHLAGLARGLREAGEKIGVHPVAFQP